MELRRSKGQIQVRAVFGLPEGLDDPAVSPDIYGRDQAPPGRLHHRSRKGATDDGSQQRGIPIALLS